MSQIQLYVDEDAAEHAVVEAIRNIGIDILTAFEARLDQQDDYQQLLFAASHNRTLYSLNVGDFCQLHQQFAATQREHAGILLIPRQRYSAGEKIRRLTDLIGRTTAEAMRNRLEFL